MIEHNMIFVITHIIRQVIYAIETHIFSFSRLNAFARLYYKFNSWRKDSSMHSVHCRMSNTWFPLYNDITKLNGVMYPVSFTFDLNWFNSSQILSYNYVL